MKMMLGRYLGMMFGRRLAMTAGVRPLRRAARVRFTGANGAVIGAQRRHGAAGASCP